MQKKAKYMSVYSVHWLLDFYCSTVQKKLLCSDAIRTCDVPGIHWVSLVL